MHFRTWSTTALVLLTTLSATLTSRAYAAQPDDLRALDGQWLYVEDITEGRASEDQGPRMNVKFTLRVEEDVVVYPRPRGDERITIDGSVIEKEDNNGSIKRYSGTWKDGALEYKLETVRLSDNKRVLLIRREFRVTPDGLQVSVAIDDGDSSVSIYRHPKDIELPEPAKATIADMEWLADAWVGTRGTSSIEERWSPPRGGAMLGTSRTVKGDKMTGFEYLRVVEREGGLVYVAQPGGRPPTEFALTKLDKTRAEFVNPRHDYPQRIVYELSDEGTVSASTGFAKGGRPRSIEFKREGK